MSQLKFDVLEAERLRQDLLEPWLHQERRVERVTIHSDSHFRMEVFQQVWTPPDAAARARLVSLGIYSKSRRPTLRVTSANGSSMPVLSRTEQAKILGYLYLQGVFSELLQADSNLNESQVISFGTKVRWYIERIISSPSKRSQEALDALKDWTDRLAENDRPPGRSAIAPMHGRD